MTLDIPAFRALFPLYSSETDYPDALLEAKYEQGKCYIKDNDCTLPEACRAYALDLMLAHLLYINDQINAGNITRVVTSATEGAVSVSLADPPSSSNFEYWFNTTPYGPQILVMLEVESASGDWIGYHPERLAFRKVGGFR